MVAPSASSLSKFLSRPPAAARGFLLYGPDEAQIAARADILTSSIARTFNRGVEVLRLYDSDLTGDPDRLHVELTTNSLFGETRIVRLASLPTKAQSSILETAGRIVEGVYIIIQAPGMKKNHKAVQAFEASSTLAAIACYGETVETLAPAILQHAAAAGYEMAREAAASIAARCDASAPLARAETEKIMVYAGSEKRISLEDVEACLADQQTAGLSEIANYALDGKAADALRSLARFMGVEQTTVPVLVVLSSLLLRLHALRAATDAGQTAAQAIKELRPPVFFKEQDRLAAQVSRWPKERLAECIHAVNEVTLQSRLHPHLAEDLVEAFLLKVAAAASSRQER
jgi:DNA polymerase-3 subunit delta